MFSIHFSTLSGTARLYPSNSAPELGYGRLITWRMNMWAHARMGRLFLHDVFTVCMQMCSAVSWLSHLDWWATWSTRMSRIWHRVLAIITNKPSKSITNTAWKTGILGYHYCSNCYLKLHCTWSAARLFKINFSAFFCYHFHNDD